ncbi:MAG: hypothetical protein QW058_01140 [Candidatus Aenigmatarchaeota archaeon]
MNIDVFEIIEGSLLGDGSINIDNYKYGRYFCYKLTAKDRKFVEWVKLIFQKFGITNCWITCDNKILNTSSLYFYINNSPYSEKLISFREKWYKRINDKTIKTIPRDLELTPLNLLFWYLGDGSLIRRKNDKNRVPFIVLATNSFLKEDIELSKRCFSVKNFRKVLKALNLSVAESLSQLELNKSENHNRNHLHKNNKSR